jgi:hypothetical protein
MVFGFLVFCRWEGLLLTQHTVGERDRRGYGDVHPSALATTNGRWRSKDRRGGAVWGREETSLSSDEGEAHMGDGREQDGSLCALHSHHLRVACAAACMHCAWSVSLRAASCFP